MSLALRREAQLTPQSSLQIEQLRKAIADANSRRSAADEMAAALRVQLKDQRAGAVTAEAGSIVKVSI